MRIINKTKSIIIDKYILKYKYIIEKQYPVLHNHTIEIYGDSYKVYIPTTLDPTVSVSKKNGENLQFDVLIVGFNYNSGANTTLLDRFGEKEIFALLSHEIGHIVADYISCCESEKEEFWADKTAQKLGLGKNMRRALTKMKEDLMQNNMIGAYNNTIKEIDKRIQKLKYSFPIPPRLYAATN